MNSQEAPAKQDMINPVVTTRMRVILLRIMKNEQQFNKRVRRLQYALRVHHILFFAKKHTLVFVRNSPVSLPQPPASAVLVSLCCCDEQMLQAAAAVAVLAVAVPAVVEALVADTAVAAVVAAAAAVAWPVVVAAAAAVARGTDGIADKHSTAAAVVLALVVQEVDTDYTWSLKDLFFSKRDSLCDLHLCDLLLVHLHALYMVAVLAVLLIIFRGHHIQTFQKTK
jgi:hypothetical protein